MTFLEVIQALVEGPRRVTMPEIKEGDRVALTAPCHVRVAGTSTGQVVPVGTKGWAGAMKTSTGYIFVQFDGGPCLLVEQASLELDSNKSEELEQPQSAISRYLFDVLTEVCDERDHPLPERVTFLHTRCVELQGFFTPDMLLDIVEAMLRDLREMSGP